MNNPLELELLSREELIELVKQLLEDKNQLQAELELYKQKEEKPVATPENSSMPPSQGQKENLSSERPKQKLGPKPGHTKSERAWVEDPDEIRELRPISCAHCESDLSNETGKLVDATQIIEIPPVAAKVIEVRQYEVTCPHCGEVQTESAPAGLEMNRTFGSRVEAIVVYYRQEQHLSYERTRIVMSELHGVELSEGAIDLIMKRVGQKAEAQVENMAEQVRQSKVVHSDETSARVMGRKWWQWVFCTATVILHILRPSRGTKVIDELLGEEHSVQVWVSDCLPAQLKPDIKHRQICLAHQLRDLQRVIEQFPTCWWAMVMQMVFRRAIHLHHQRDELSTEAWEKERDRLKRVLDWLLKRPVEFEPAKKLQARFLKHREHILLFLDFEGVEPTNNVAERALRPSVIHRKVTNCFRSEWGARAYAAIASVIDTAELHGKTAFQAILDLLPPSPIAR